MLIIYRDRFLKLGSELDLKKFTELLEKRGIEYTIASTSSEVSSENKIIVESKQAAGALYTRKIFYNAALSIHWRQFSNLPGYFIFKPKHSKIDNNAFLEAVNSFARFLKKMSILQYSLSQNQKTKLVKLVPAFGHGTSIDMNCKIVTVLLCAFGWHALKHFELGRENPTTNVRVQDCSGHSLSYPSESVYWTNLRKLLSNTERSVVELLKQFSAISGEMTALYSSKAAAVSKGSDIEIKSSHDIKPIPDRVTFPVRSCAFCNEQVIRNQLVLDLRKILIILNYQPHPGTKIHFLILPARHIEDWSDLDFEERYIFAKALFALTTAIQAHSIAQHEIISHVQNGVLSGQTVSHSHSHVMSKPNLFSYLLGVLRECSGYAASTRLTPVEMNKIAEAYKPEILSVLLFDCSPKPLRVSYRPDVIEHVVRQRPQLLFNYRFIDENRGPICQLIDHDRVDYAKKQLRFQKKK